MKLIKIAAALITLLSICSCFIGGALYQNEIPILVPNFDKAPTTLSYSDVKSFYAKNYAIKTLTPTTDGSGNLFYTITPSLPVGLTINSQSGEISGTPTETITSQTYTVTLSNSAGVASSAFTLTIYPSFVTTSTSDDGDDTIDGVCATSGGVCTLRAAIEEINAGTELTVATLPPYSGTDIIPTTPIVISKDAIILGDEDAPAQIDVGSSADRAIQINAAINARFENLVFKGGAGTRRGIQTTTPAQTINLKNVTFDSIPFRGAKLDATSEITVENCTFKDNHYALEANGNPTTIKNSFFQNNSGNGGFNAPLLLSSTGGPATVENNTFTASTMVGGNSASAIMPQVNTNILNNTFYLNPGGGAEGVIHSTFFGAVLNISNNTFADNGARSVIIQIGTANVKGNIFINQGTPAFSGTVNSLGYNLSDDNAAELTDGTDLPNRLDSEINLGTYGDNGGDVPTIPLLSGSLAIGHIIEAECLSTDARGVSRSGSTCDAGAYEAD